MTIQEALNNIKNAVFGRDVRQSIHDGIKGINDESKADMQKKQETIDTYTAKQDLLDQKYDNLLDELSKTDPSLAEVVDARMKEDGTSFPSLKKRLDASDVKIDAILSEVHPVGSIYISIINVNPATYFGGAWVPWGNGRFPIAVDTRPGIMTELIEAEIEGGETTHMHSTGGHILTENEMPNHRHAFTGGTVEKKGTVDGPGYVGPAIWGRTSDQQGKYEMNGATLYAGGGNAHNHGNTGSASNMPPFITCYMWKRIG